jgi:hypothetical protein
MLCPCNKSAGWRQYLQPDKFSTVKAIHDCVRPFGTISFTIVSQQNEDRKEKNKLQVKFKYMGIYGLYVMSKVIKISVYGNIRQNMLHEVSELISFSRHNKTEYINR